MKLWRYAFLIGSFVGFSAAHSAENQSWSIKADYIEAIVYKGLLLRLKANQSKDVKEQQDLLKKANQLQEEAAAMKKKQTEGK